MKHDTGGTFPLLLFQSQNCSRDFVQYHDSLDYSCTLRVKFCIYRTGRTRRRETTVNTILVCPSQSISIGLLISFFYLYIQRVLNTAMVTTSSLYPDSQHTHCHTFPAETFLRDLLSDP